MDRRFSGTSAPIPGKRSRASTSPPGPTGSVFSVVLIPTLACNCSCRHCFEHLDGRRFPDTVWTAVFSRLLDLADTVQCKTLRVYWQGGEVFCLGPASVRQGLQACSSVFRDRGITIDHHLQTNLLLYDSTKWKDVVREFGLGTISSSLDYPNVYRAAPGLAPDGYAEAWRTKRDEAVRDGFTVSVIALPNAETLRLGAERFCEYYQDEMGVQNVQVNFPFPGPENQPDPLDLAALAGFMVDLYHVWVASDRALNLSPLRAIEDRMFRGTGTLPCSWTYSCAKTLLAIGPDGEVGQCDCWVSALPERNFGNLHESSVHELLDSDGRRPFLERPLLLGRESKCGECPFWRMCYGGCPVRAFAFTGDVSARDHYCPVYKSLFSTVLEAGRSDQNNNKWRKR